MCGKQERTFGNSVAHAKQMEVEVIHAYDDHVTRILNSSRAFLTDDLSMSMDASHGSLSHLIKCTGFR